MTHPPSRGFLGSWGCEAQGRLLREDLSNCSYRKSTLPFHLKSVIAIATLRR